MSPAIERVPGSFRDPGGFVFIRDGVLYRRVNRSYAPDYDQLVQSGLARDLVAQGLLIGHEEVQESWHDPAAYKLLRPERVRFISYPYEWSFGQLRDAALLTLRVQRRAVESGMSLKDASAYNVQFVGGRPTLIDTLSFERYVEGRPWVAYRQFCQHFLAPLALMSYCDVRLSRLLGSFIDGVPLDMARTLLPWRTRARPSLLAHLHLHAWMQKKHSRGTEGPGAKPSLSRAGLKGIIDSLESAVSSLEWTPQGTEWADYYSDTNYSDQSLAEKARLVGEWLDRTRPGSVWDLGANTGRFSRLASSRGVHTVAFDADAAAVERAYRDTVARHDGHLLPLVLDLSNPSPSLGWAGQERLSLQARGPADAVFALALVHHLAIGNNVPFDGIATFLGSVAKRLIVEFVPKSDSQVQRMLATRDDVFPDYTRPAFEQAFERMFVIDAVEPIGGTERILYCMQRRDFTSPS